MATPPDLPTLDRHWRDGPTRDAIVAFVTAAVDEHGVARSCRRPR